MYLKCIRVNGFKSFAEKLELDMNPGITGIVGPNGSGKSNILDAVRWVLGEQSVKALRGTASMTDVIFAGSKERGAQTRASVSLVFDNSDHYLNSEFTEIEVKRIVYKTGENEYYINNAKVRLKDITDLFIDSGAGKESFNIISQGAVADIINSKPEDRRVIFEEAACVLKYKKRKEESFRKLDKTNENLARVNLLIDELMTTLTPLQEQSEKARKFLEYKTELESIEIALIANDIENINKEYLDAKNKVERINKELEKLNLDNSSDSLNIEELKAKSLKLDEEIESKTSIVVELAAELERLNSQKQITLERQKYVLDGTKLEESIVSLKEEVMKMNNNVLAAMNDVESLRRDLEVKQLRSMELIKYNEDKKNRRNSISKEINEVNKEILSINNKIDILSENIANDTRLPYSVKNVINNIRLKGIRGVLGRLIEVPEKYVTAIETSLGANTNVVVVDSEKEAKDAINYLKENKLGRATFFPISIIKGRNVLYEDLNLIKDVDGYIGVASELVQYDDKYKDIVLNQLGNVIVVDSIDTLNKVGRILRYRYKIVSLDGEIQFAGGAITGGNTKNNNGLLNQKYELDALKKELDEKKKKLSILDSNMSAIIKDVEKASSDLEVSQREVVLLTEQVNYKNDYLKEMKNSYESKNSELQGVLDKKDNTLDKELDNIINEYYEKSALRDKETRELDKLKTQRSDLNTEIALQEKAYREANSDINARQNELKNEEIKLGRMDVKLDSLLISLNENYNMTYEKAKEEYPLEIDVATARVTVSNLKGKIKTLGEVNTGSIAEYERVNERYTFLTTQRDDLEGSVSSLLKIIDEMDELMKSKFMDTFLEIKKEFEIVFKKLFKGGEGVLELTDPNDILNTGIEISALPPGKKLNSIVLLSGGEKTLTAIALLFAILNVKPVPFVILDEVEAALDEANVDAFGNYLLSRKERSQFIIITHKKRTMEYADVLYGITMQESGVSKLVSVKLED